MLACNGIVGCHLSLGPALGQGRCIPLSRHHCNLILERCTQSLPCTLLWVSDHTFSGIVIPPEIVKLYFVFQDANRIMSSRATKLDGHVTPALSACMVIVCEGVCLEVLFIWTRACHRIYWHLTDLDINTKTADDICGFIVIIYGIQTMNSQRPFKEKDVITK